MDDNRQGQRRAMTQVAATRHPTYSHCLISLAALGYCSAQCAFCERLAGLGFLQVTGSPARPANGKREHNYGPQSVLRIFKQLQFQRNSRTLCRPIKLYSLIRGIMPAAWQDSYC